MHIKKTAIAALGVLLLSVAAWISWAVWLTPTRILIVNPLPAQAADITLNNDSRHIRVETATMEEAGSFDRYDVVVLFGRSLFLDEAQMEQVERAARKGVKFYTITLRNFNVLVNRNIDEPQGALLYDYLNNPNHQNYRNALRYLRSIATPGKYPREEYDNPVTIPSNLYYHREYGRYFETPDELATYLKEKGVYHEKGRNIALIAGSSMPMEGNRAHVDTIISRLTARGLNVYPVYGNRRGEMLRELKPDAVVYFPMGRLGNDSLINWLHAENIPIFAPYPLIQSTAEWLDPMKPVSGGTLTARVVVPEIDGAMAPMLIATQNLHKSGYHLYTPEGERIENFVSHLHRYMSLRDKPNADKKVAVCYFKTPGKDALLASGMEVIPSLYGFLRRLQSEGYDLRGLPATVGEFEKQLLRDGVVMGSYAKGAQDEFLAKANPVWLSTEQYEEWAKKRILPQKYKEVVDRYGEAPGELLVRTNANGGSEIAVACLRYGNVLLFPQPRPALGDDEFRLQHGVPVAPPHSYLAPYLYMQDGFGADAIIHFGTHGNLEYTPGKNVALSQNDWADILVGDLPHFYYYTTANVGEGIIAKRRTHAVLVTHLTPPFVESGMRRRYNTLFENIHRLLDDGVENHRPLAIEVKKEVLKLGLHRDLGLDSLPETPYTATELERLDQFMEEIANEKTTGAFYTLGREYTPRDLITTTLAVSADELAYELARADRDEGLISTEQLQNYAFVAERYLSGAKRILTPVLQNPPRDTTGMPAAVKNALRYKELLQRSSRNELDAMLRGLDGGTVPPAPGGDPVLNPNVLPTGRNMYSINVETTPGQRAWEEGKRLADNTLELYKEKHGDYPRKVSYTFWAGEFITTEGATVAQALWMLGVELVRDGQNRVVDLRLVPSEELGRPRINVVIQISGQLRDIAASRLKLITEAIRLASSATDDIYPNHVADGTLSQEKALVENGLSPKRAREVSVMRIFGPVNSGYSTGMMAYTEKSGKWDDPSELVAGYLNNMGAMYGDDDNWGAVEKNLFAGALDQTDVVIQPRQSNTWGPLSLDHVYEFTGAISLAVKTLTGKEPDAYMADYRNRNNKRMQNVKEAVAVEARATILNPTFIAERIKGEATTAQMFGETFRNIFGWNVMRPSALDPELYNELYDTYIIDKNGLGLRDYFDRVNPAAWQAMTSVMIESARKGYWRPSDEQLETILSAHTASIEKNGAGCTEFICDNEKLQTYIADNLRPAQADAFNRNMRKVKESAAAVDGVVLKQDNTGLVRPETPADAFNYAVIGVIAAVCIGLILFFVYRRKNG